MDADPAAADAAGASRLPTRTLAIIKPDAVMHADEILHIAELAGFTIIQQTRIQLTTARAEEFYTDHRERPFFPGLVEFMASGPVVAAVLARQDAVRTWRELIGPTNSLDARVKAPKSLRALYGSDGTRNAVHGSDSAASAAREIAFFFPRLPPTEEAGGTVRGQAARAYVAERLQPTLVKALTALAKAKPSSEKEDALGFLAQYLLDNNPNKPRRLVPVTATPPEATQPVATAAPSSAKHAAGLQQSADATNSTLQQEGGLAAGSAGAAAGMVIGIDEAEQRRREAARAAQQDEAATKVQAAFRGHQARQQIADMREVTAS